MVTVGWINPFQTLSHRLLNLAGVERGPWAWQKGMIYVSVCWTESILCYKIFECTWEIQEADGNSTSIWCMLKLVGGWNQSSIQRKKTWDINVSQFAAWKAKGLFILCWKMIWNIYNSGDNLQFSLDIYCLFSEHKFCKEFTRCKFYVKLTRFWRYEKITF